jgi:hypothetical protein
MMEPIPLKAPAGGVRRDQDPEDVSPTELAAAENMIYRDGNFQVRPGYKVFADDIGERPMGYVQYDLNDANQTVKVVQGTDQGWHALAGSTWNNITGTPLTGGITDQVVFRTFSKSGFTYLLGTNGTDDLKVWDGVSLTYRSASGNPPRARCMCVIFDRIVLGNLLSGGTPSPLAIDVSANKDFDAGWGSVLVALLADTEGEIVSMLEMGTQIAAILKTDAIVKLIAQESAQSPFRLEWVKVRTFSGPGSTLLSFKLTNGSIGCLGRDGIVSIFDGAAVSLLPYAVQKQIVSTANLARINRGWSVYDSDRRELWLVYPLIGSTEPNGGVMVNMTTYGVYPFRFPNLYVTAGAKIRTTSGLTIGDLTSSIGSLNMTIGEFASASAVRRFVIGESNGQSFEDSAYTDNGDPIPFFWESGVQGEAEKYRTITKIRHRFSPPPESQQISVELGTRNEGGNINYQVAQSIDVQANGKKITGHRTTAEYMGLRYSGQATQPIVYQGAAAYVAPRGTWR